MIFLTFSLLAKLTRIPIEFFVVPSAKFSTYKKVSYYNFNTIGIIGIPVGKAARFAKSETREYRGDCLALISVTNKYLVFKIYGIPHYASLYAR